MTAHITVLSGNAAAKPNTDSKFRRVFAEAPIKLVHFHLKKTKHRPFSEITLQHTQRANARRSNWGQGGGGLGMGMLHTLVKKGQISVYISSLMVPMETCYVE